MSFTVCPDWVKASSALTFALNALSWFAIAAIWASRVLILSSTPERSVQATPRERMAIAEANLTKFFFISFVFY